MNIGTKSLLFGVHNFLIHPIMVAIAWYKLYGFPRDLRVWVAFIVHDWGYWGLKDLDGVEGDMHPYTGAEIMHFLFDKHALDMEWYYFALYHSRFLAKKNGGHPSKLCMADKLAICCYPAWLVIFLSTLSGEIEFFMNEETIAKHAHMGLDYTDKWTFIRTLQPVIRKYVMDHKDGQEDNYTVV